VNKVLGKTIPYDNFEFTSLTVELIFLVKEVVKYSSVIKVTDLKPNTPYLFCILATGSNGQRSLPAVVQVYTKRSESEQLPIEKTGIFASSIIGPSVVAATNTDSEKDKPDFHVPKPCLDTVDNQGINSNTSSSGITVELLQQQFRAAQHDLAVAFAEQKSLSAVQEQEVRELETTLQEARDKLKTTEVNLKSTKIEHGQALNVASTKESQKLLLRDRIAQFKSRRSGTQQNQKDLSKKIFDVNAKILEYDASIAAFTLKGQANYEKAQKDLEQPRMVVTELEKEVKALTTKLKEMRQIQAVSLEAIKTIQAKKEELAPKSVTDAAAIVADKKIYDTIRSLITIEGLHSNLQDMLQNEIEEFDREEKEYSQIRDRFTKQYEELYPHYQEYLEWERQRQGEEVNSTGGSDRLSPSRSGNALTPTTTQSSSGSRRRRRSRSRRRSKSRQPSFVNRFIPDVPMPALPDFMLMNSPVPTYSMMASPNEMYNISPILTQASLPAVSMDSNHFVVKSSNLFANPSSYLEGSTIAQSQSYAIPRTIGNTGNPPASFETISRSAGSSPNLERQLFRATSTSSFGAGPASYFQSFQQQQHHVRPSASMEQMKSKGPHTIRHMVSTPSMARRSSSQFLTVDMENYNALTSPPQLNQDPFENTNRKNSISTFAIQPPMQSLQQSQHPPARSSFEEIVQKSGNYNAASLRASDTSLTDSVTVKEWPVGNESPATFTSPEKEGFEVAKNQIDKTPSSGIFSWPRTGPLANPLSPSPADKPAVSPQTELTSSGTEGSSGQLEVPTTATQRLHSCNSMSSLNPSRSVSSFTSIWSGTQQLSSTESQSSRTVQRSVSQTSQWSFVSGKLQNKNLAPSLHASASNPGLTKVYNNSYQTTGNGVSTGYSQSNPPSQPELQKQLSYPAKEKTQPVYSFGPVNSGFITSGLDFTGGAHGGIKQYASDSFLGGSYSSSANNIKYDEDDKGADQAASASLSVFDKPMATDQPILEQQTGALKAWKSFTLTRTNSHIIPPQTPEHVSLEKSAAAAAVAVSAATAAVKSPGHSPGWNLFKFLNHDSKEHKDYRESKKELRSIFSSVFSTKSASSNIDTTPLPAVEMLAPRIELSLLDAVPEIRSIENDSDAEESSNPSSPVLVSQPDPRVNSVTAAEALADPAWPPVFDTIFDNSINPSLNFSTSDALNFNFLADKSKPLTRIATATTMDNKSSSTVTVGNNSSNSTLATTESSASSTNHHNSSNNTSNSIAKGFKRTFSITRRRASSSSNNSNGTTSGIGSNNLGAAGNNTNSSDGNVVGSGPGDPHHSKLMRKISFFQK
jgi:hypothetical protein